MKKFLFISLLLSFGCEKRKPNVELIQDMMQSPAIKAQDYDDDSTASRAMSLPPEGAVPVGHTPYEIQTPEEAGLKLKNELLNTDDVLLRGQRGYYIYCWVCHGDVGRGDGPVADKLLLKPPSLLTEKARNYQDGYLYHMIVRGRGFMGSYAAQIPDETDRWAIVNFIRRLQGMTEVEPDVVANPDGEG